MAAAVWNGSRWAAATPPLNSAGLLNAGLTGVSCVSPSSCLAVGDSDQDDSAPLSYLWNGHHWRSLTMPGGDGFLDAVSCASASACLAVGGGSTGPWLAESWNGQDWAVQTVPGPAAVMSGVSCPAATACTAVGTAGQQLRIERWNGTAWTAQTPAAAGSGAEFSGVSCASATACTAVGGYPVSQSAQAPLAQVWNGSRWVSQQLPATGSSVLTAVSCTAPAVCTAAGWRAGNPWAGALILRSG